MIPAWVDGWIGKKYADKSRGPACDCWGLTRAVLMAERGVE
jgi:cell wall-associated NlpC family hydrolase